MFFSDLFKGAFLDFLLYVHCIWNSIARSIYCFCLHCVQDTRLKHIYVHGLFHRGLKGRTMKILCNGLINPVRTIDNTKVYRLDSVTRPALSKSRRTASLTRVGMLAIFLRVVPSNLADITNWMGWIPEGRYSSSVSLSARPPKVTLLSTLTGNAATCCSVASGNWGAWGLFRTKVAAVIAALLLKSSLNIYSRLRTVVTSASPSRHLEVFVQKLQERREIKFSQTNTDGSKQKISGRESK